ncbi:MAG: YbjQ family protein [Bacteroidales bacterium]|mgnify:FL=1|nr:YbjQ family protein [Bacteroidales bacterium]
MILTTTPTIQGKEIKEYCGIVSGETVIGANAIKDFKASLKDFFGGRSHSYEKVLRKGKATALKEMEDQAMSIGAHAVVGIDLDYETINNMLIVTCSGTAVKF